MRVIRFVLAAVVVMGAGAVRAEEKVPVKVVPLIFGMRAPEIAVTDLEGKAVTLDSFKGKPVVLQFGSITEPVFRKHVPDGEKLAESFIGKVAVVVIYQKEAHAADGEAALEVNTADGFGIAAPVTEEERVKLAKMAVERLGLKQQTVLVDAFNDTTSRRYGGRPNATFVLDSRGGLAAAYPWFDVAKVRGALTAVLADKPVPAEFQGPVKSETIPAAAFESADGRLSLAIALDSLALNNKQKEAVYPPIVELMADLREFRETRITATTAPAAGAGAGAKPVDDLQTWLPRFRADYEKVKGALKENLSEGDAKKTLEALDRTIPPRLINNMGK